MMTRTDIKRLMDRMPTEILDEMNAEEVRNFGSAFYSVCQELARRKDKAQAVPSKKQPLTMKRDETK